MNKIVLNDGTEYIGATCGFSDGVVVCFIPEGKMTDVFADFSDPLKTDHVAFYYGEMSKEYDGYTECIGIFKGRYTPEITVQLFKEA